MGLDLSSDGDPFKGFVVKTKKVQLSKGSSKSARNVFTSTSLQRRNSDSTRCSQSARSAASAATAAAASAAGASPAKSFSASTFSGAERRSSSGISSASMTSVDESIDDDASPDRGMNCDKHPSNEKEKKIDVRNKMENDENSIVVDTPSKEATPLTVSIRRTGSLMMTMTQKQWRRQTSFPGVEGSSSAQTDDSGQRIGDSNCYMKKYHEQHALKTLLAFTDDHLDALCVAYGDSEPEPPFPAKPLRRTETPGSPKNSPAPPVDIREQLQRYLRQTDGDASDDDDRRDDAATPEDAPDRPTDAPKRRSEENRVRTESRTTLSIKHGPTTTRRSSRAESNLWKPSTATTLARFETATLETSGSQMPSPGSQFLTLPSSLSDLRKVIKKSNLLLSRVPHRNISLHAALRRLTLAAFPHAKKCPEFGPWNAECRCASSRFRRGHGPPPHWDCADARFCNVIALKTLRATSNLDKLREMAAPFPLPMECRLSLENYVSLEKQKVVEPIDVDSKFMETLYNRKKGGKGKLLKGGELAPFGRQSTRSPVLPPFVFVQRQAPSIKRLVRDGGVPDQEIPRIVGLCP